VLSVIGADLVAIGIGLVLPRTAVILYCVVAVALVVPFREVSRLVSGRPHRA
jgi:hypothetical protein